MIAAHRPERIQECGLCLVAGLVNLFEGWLLDYVITCASTPSVIVVPGWLGLGDDARLYEGLLLLLHLAVVL